MDKISRYIFIFLSFAVFVVAAPLILLYVSGIRLDIASRDYKPSGILTAKTIPDNAKLFLNDKETSTTPATVRFLAQGEYDVRLSLQDYFDWNKRLPVELNKVTYAHEGVESIHLIKKPVLQTLIPHGVTSFASLGNTIWSGSANTLSWQSFDSFIGNDKLQSVALPFTPE